MKWYTPNEDEIKEIDRLGIALTGVINAVRPTDQVALYTLITLIENLAGAIADKHPELKNQIVDYIATVTDQLIDAIRNNHGLKTKKEPDTDPSDGSKDKDQISQ